MEYVQLGSTGLEVSRVGFGCAGLGDEYGGVTDGEATAVVAYAIDHGISYFDTSAYYGRGLSEERLGRALLGRRDKIVLATKGGRFDVALETGFDFSYDGIVRSCESSLRRLETDWIDVYQLHDIEFGDRTEVFEEAMRALADLQRAGKVRFIGVTGYPTPLLTDAVETLDLDVVLSYCRYNLMDRSLEERLLPAARRRGTAVINASILHMGMLSQKGPQPWHPAPDRIKDVARRVGELCRARGISVSDIATQFALANREITLTLIGSSRIDTVARSLAAAQQPLDPDQVAAIDQVIGPDNLNVAWASGRPVHWEPSVLA